MIATRPRMTADEFMRLPDDGRKFELVDGEPKEVPTKQRHEFIIGWLISLMMPFARGRGALLAGGAGFRMTNGNIRCPDVSFIRRENLPGGQVPDSLGDSAPELCVEVISASEDMRDARRKVGEYFESGARQVWQMFPDTEMLTVFDSPAERREFGPDDEVALPDILPGFRARVTELFGAGAL
jgi:Uma2 family endonuclease